MVLDTEKADLEASNRISLDFNDSILHPGATSPNVQEKTGSLDNGSIHSHSSIVTAEPVHTKGEAAQRTKSRASSTRSRALSLIPRSKRRGLLGRFTIVPEVENPKEYQRRTKWIITALIALAAAAAPMGSAIFLREYSQHQESSHF